MTVSLPSEPALMRLVQADDTDAFGALYDLLVSRALGVANAICGDEERAADAVQEGFLAVWRARDDYRPDKGSVPTWVLAIIRHRAIDSNRHNSRHDRSRAAEGALAAVPTAENVDSDLLARDDRERLRAMLAKLPPAQREVIVLAYFGGLTHTEISTALALPPGTVKGRVRLGLKKLRVQITA